MKVAKNMDSVFDDCTEKELDFEAMFDEDDCLIDMVAGVNEAGEPVTGEDYDINTEDVDPMIGEKPDADYQKDGEDCTLKDAEGTKDTDLEVGGEVGDGKEVSGKENSAESHAHDEIDLNVDKKTMTLEADGEGPLEDDDEAARAGETSDTAVSTEEVSESLLDKLAESIIAKLQDQNEEKKEDINDDDKDIEEIAKENAACKDCQCDASEREGSVKHDTQNVEGKSTDVMGASVKGDSNSDPINLKLDDEDYRDGKSNGVKDTEGVSVKVVGAAQESGDIDKEMDDEELVDLVIDDELNNRIIPDSVQHSDDANEIDIKLESDESELVSKSEDDDEVDIELIDKDEFNADDQELDIDYDDDDDKLIDAVINGEV